MASGLTPQKRFVLRVSLVTGSTLATIIGAQSLIALKNAETFGVTPVAATATLSQIIPMQAEQAIETPLAQVMGTEPVSTDQPTMTPTVVRAMPSITVLRHPGQQSTVVNSAPAATTVTRQTSAIVPPQPAELAPPAPIVVQAPPQVIVQQSGGGGGGGGGGSSAPAPVTRSS